MLEQLAKATYINGICQFYNSKNAHAIAQCGCVQLMCTRDAGADPGFG